MLCGVKLQLAERGQKVSKIKERKVRRAPMGNDKDRNDFVISICSFSPFSFCSPNILHSISGGQEIARTKVKCYFDHYGRRNRNSNSESESTLQAFYGVLYTHAGRLDQCETTCTLIFN